MSLNKAQLVALLKLPEEARQLMLDALGEGGQQPEPSSLPALYHPKRSNKSRKGKPMFKTLTGESIKDKVFANLPEYRTHAVTCIEVATLTGLTAQRVSGALYQLKQMDKVERAENEHGVFIYWRKA